ncbi:relaxase domain-containing protein [Frankia sp. CNm7]|uniref:Relaxase domain-containing protein n=1 Tax=Frankia nepalensis TaxID=1836974 RepID=A0A937RPF6_9ACTN|nr:MobF family relaxase [Frankia nepalensis]MBL7499775.1 relaxase domain-containing protein [Frankia nepalensis]MBL7512260.1 relaxase domain-containing protein [Frankia nepalensis]MBL7520455.1 relaxase domain-containing protein [Frankia nepalensis]MBL7632590.1 relaxase domain-containing protein [Frankia nepalensis]
MIATARVLRVRPTSPGDLGRAVRAVVAYVEGGQPGSSAELAGYYGRAAGWARGQLAELVGLRSEVTGQALARLLEGRHAVTGLPLLAAAGSAARARSADPASAGPAGRSDAASGHEDELLTLAEASVLAGVSATYLRFLLGNTAHADARQTSTDGGSEPSEPAAGLSADGVRIGQAVAGQAGDDAAPSPPGGGLGGVKGTDGQWRVRRGDLERWIAARVAPATVLGFDIVCAAPKSVSLLWAFGDPAIRADVAGALDAAVNATISYLERHAAFGKVAGHNRRATGLVAASYLHDVSRSVEAHLHVHNIVINAVVVPADEDDPDGQARGGGAEMSGWEWRAVDGEVLLSHIRTAGFVGAAVLRHELTQRLGLQWGPVRNGVAELAAFPTDLLAAFSTRHGQVMEEFAQLVAAGFEPSGATMTAAQRGSRTPKQVLADDAVRALQVERLTAAGWTVDQVRQLATAAAEHRPQPVSDQDVADLFTQLTGPTGLTEKTTTFDRRDVVRHIAALSRDRLGGEAIDLLADRFLGDPRVVHLFTTTPGQRRRQEPEPLYTVEDMLAAEQRLLALIRQGRVAAGAAPRVLASPRLVDAYLAAAARGPSGPDATWRGTSGANGANGANTAGASGASGAARGLSPLRADAARAHRAVGPRTGDAARAGRAGLVLSVEQAEVVRRLLVDQDLVRLAVGAAGTGKTEAMRVLTAIVQAEGRAVFATAHGGRQAEELADRIGVPARVVASWLTLLDAVDADPVGDLAGVWPSGSVLIVDEATQVGTRDAVRLLTYAARTGTVVILLGDPAQLGSVAAGGWFRHLVETTLDVPTLTTVHRQAGPELAAVRAALDALRGESATPMAALDRLATAGKIHLADGPDTLFAQAVADWYAERRRHLDATRHQADADGPGDGAARPPPARPPKPVRAHLMAERHREVEALNQAARAILTADGTLTGPALTVAGRQFQAGDEVVTLTQTGHTLIPAGRPASAYIRTGTIGVITAIHANPGDLDSQTVTVYFPSKGTVTVPWAYLTHQFDDGRDGGLTHAYALTAAKAQGSTMNTARAVVTDDTTRPGLYVMLSRARTDLAAYLIRRDDLNTRDDDETWLPATPPPGSDDPIERLAARLDRSQPDQPTHTHDPLATAAHQLRATHTLAELTALRLSRWTPEQRPGPGVPVTSTPATARPTTSGAAHAPHAPFAPNRAAPLAPDEPNRAARPAPEGGGTPAGSGAGPAAPDGLADSRGAPVGGVPWQVVLRRAELAAEAAIRAAALADPHAELVVRLGPRPAAGPRRAAWDDAVGGLAIYHARHQPTAPAWATGPPPGATPHDRERDPWLLQRGQAVRLADTWAAPLPDPVRTRFTSPGQTVPRQRAIAGLHALLDAGHPADQLAAGLRQDPVDHIRTAAAVLDHRVTALCRHAGLDPTLYDLPTPSTAQEEWNTINGQLARAETIHLATSPTSALAAERRSLTTALAPPAGHSTPGPAKATSGATTRQAGLAAKANLEERLRRVEAALDHQTTDAILHAESQAAGYLTALLGPRPHDGAATTGWDQAAGRVEHYRHHHLGLPYGTPAHPDTTDPTQHALGNRPANPTDATAYDQARDIGSLHGGQLTL